jgi:hypothetical protein
MGGSRADGTVDLAFEYGAFEEPQVNDAQGVDLAASTCAGWGYTASQPFGGTMTKCESVNGYGNCLRTLVTRKYPCVGAPGSSVTPQREPVALSPAQSNPAQPLADQRPSKYRGLRRCPARACCGGNSARPEPECPDQSTHIVRELVRSRGIVFPRPWALALAFGLCVTILFR